MLKSSDRPDFGEWRGTQIREKTAEHAHIRRNVM